MRDVLIIAHFSDDFDTRGNNRFNYLAELIAKENFSVELITSDFSHNKKRKREKNNTENLIYQVTFVEEPVYKKNVSLKRFYSHHIMAKNLERYLKSRKKPNVIYCAVPSLDVAATTAKYACENNIKFIIDIQDLWPEAFKMVFDIPVLSELVFYSMKKKADYIYKSADEIVAVSQTYLNRALNVNRKVQKGKVVFLGTDLNKFDEVFLVNRYQNKPENEVWIAYVGTLGHSYDLISVFDAIEILMNEGINNLKFIIMGDGPLKEKFKQYSESKKINALFTGRLPYSKMVGILGVCDIAVNPIASRSAGSIINKHGDYAAAGLPVINTQESLEYRNLVTKYNMGFNCVNGDPRDIADKIQLLIRSDKREEMGHNSRKLAEERFDRKKTYSDIVKLIKTWS